MKIPFDIKYRPQIESGEYKVETRDGRRVKIIYWDLNCTSPIVAVMDVHIDLPGEIVDIFSVSGMAFDDSESPSDLFIVTPEPELTEFEADVLVILLELVEEVDANDVKRISKELLELAKKELDYEKRKALSCSYKIGFRDGKAKGYEEAMKEFKELPTVWPPKIYTPSCPYNTGGCTNPMHDCINCPSYSIAGISTTTGTSSAKVESHE